MKDKERKTNGAEAANEGSGNGATEIKQPMPDEKTEHAQHSSELKTKAGETDSSSLGYLHGLCALHLFRSGEHRKPDQEAYIKLASYFSNYYQPEGAVEEFMVEKIVTEMVRYARMIGYEQELLFEFKYPFNRYQTETDKMLRYATSSERQLMRSMRELERIQSERKKVSGKAENSSDSQEARRHSGPSSDNNWFRLGSIIYKGMTQTENEQKAEPKGQISPQKVTPPAPKKILADIITEAIGLPPRAHDVSTKDRETNPPSSAPSDGAPSAEK